MPIQYRPYVGPPANRQSSIAELIVTEERAAYIQSVLYPEHEWTGRPFLIASDPSSRHELELKADKRSVSPVEHEAEPEPNFASGGDSFADEQQERLAQAA